MGTKKFSVKYCVLLPLVLLITIFLLAVPTSFFGIEGLTVLQQRTIALFVFAALMWIFEIIPSWTTSVLIIVLALLMLSNKGLGFLMVDASGEKLEGIMNYTKIMSAFADPVVMLFLGGFALAIMAQKYGLDVTLARVLLKPFGTNPKMVLLGFLTVIAVFSMFMSNTATAAMMLTFLTPVLMTLPADGGGRISFALAIPIAANLGGMGTPIGTPPNAIALGALQEAGFNITFVGWMIRMVPFVIVMLVFAWFLLTKMFPFKAKTIELKIEGAPVKVTPFQKYVVWFTFALTILLWVFEGLIGVNSNIVAMIPFAVFSATGILKARDLEHINWAVLWMVAGGFALGTALNQTGLATTLINTIPFASWNALVVMLVGGFICYFLSNFISNSAAANLVVPILIVVGKAMAGNPSFEALGGIPSMIAGIAICASVAMCLPVSTPPNALAASTGMISTKQMATVGIIIGVVGFILGYAMLIFVGF